MPDEPSGHGFFPSTDWSLVGHAGHQSDRQRPLALDELLRQYWPALRAHLVNARRMDPNESDDLLQGFIADKVLEQNLVGRAEPGRGRFRGLLISALDNYVANVWRRRGTHKRTVERAVPLEPQDQDRRLTSQLAPDDTFDVQWARQLLLEVAARMKAECMESGRGRLWDVFAGRILAPILEGATPLSYQDLVEQYGFVSPAQASNALMTAKRMYARLLRAAVAEYALDDEDIDTEIRDLQRIVSQ